MRRFIGGKLTIACAAALCAPAVTVSGAEGPALQGTRITQEAITSGALSRDEIRLAGRTMFVTPFNKQDGFGDGDPALDGPSAELGKRTTLQGNGAFLRLNGLDAQTCLECHSVVSRATVPMKFGVGGVGGMNNTVLGAGGASFADLVDAPDGPSGGDAHRNINGRVINPPFIFGAGGVELLAKEMTRDLQVHRQFAQSNPDTPVELLTKGVSFGTLLADGNGNLDTSGVSGVDADPSSDTFLVVQPFGRKGDNMSTRTFDIGAFQFHFGMQPVEVVGRGVDGDNDGVVDEVLEGELSAISIFVATADRPRQTRVRGTAREGRRLFNSMGCTECHRPALQTTTNHLTFSFPEIPQDPDANVYYAVDLTKPPMNFPDNDQGGVTVPLFADLKRHNMGPALAEQLPDGTLDDSFTTARLWGVADTAPYLHDGRALTLTDAILTHGGEGSEAKPAVDNFRSLSEAEQHAVIAFLNTLRTPAHPDRDLERLAKQLAHQGHNNDH